MGAGQESEADHLAGGASQEEESRMRAGGERVFEDAAKIWYMFPLHTLAARVSKGDS
jgi:hypothetical protein